MKEKRSYKRFDLISALAVIGMLAVLLFECFFVFELYNRDIEPLERFLLSTKETVPVEAEEPAPVEEESVPTEEKPAPADDSEPVG